MQDAPTAAFLARLQDVVEAGAGEAGPAALAELLRAAADALETTGEALSCRIVPFVPGSRPSDEAAHPASARARRWR